MNREKNSVQVAVVGCGYWGKNLVRNFAQLRALTWLCDKSETALKAQSELYPQIHITTNFQEIINNPEIQGVVLATPAAMHYSQAKEALLHGKDVFVEKPLSLRYKEGKELVEIAETRSAVLMVGHILEYHPAITLLKKLVYSGELGKLLYIYSNRLNLGKVRQEENILWSFAPHDIAVISSLLHLEPTEVISVGGTYLQSGIADVTVTNLVFPQNIRAHIFVSWLHPSKEQKLVVIGDRKMAVFNDTVKEGKLKLYDKGIEWQGGLPVARQTSETILFTEDKEPLLLECQHFLECIKKRDTPLTDGSSALKVLRILEASELSLQKGGLPISLNEIGE